MAKSTSRRNDRIEVEVSNAAASRAGKRGLGANFHGEKGGGAQCERTPATDHNVFRMVYRGRDVDRMRKSRGLS